jgi:4-amino-4-deoxy-L-arabinose transferase-like glycosyltransferase
MPEPPRSAVDRASGTGASAGAATTRSWSAPRGGVQRLVVITLTAVAVGLAWGGQALTTRALPDHLSALDVMDRLFPVYKNKRELSAAFILLCAGALALGLISLWRREPHGDEPLSRPVRPFRMNSRTDAIVLLGAAAGVGLWALFLRALYDGHYRHPWNLVLLAALLLLALPLAMRDAGGRWPRARARVRAVVVLEMVFLACVVGGFIYLNARDLGSWKYSAVGDEYNNFAYGLGIAKGALFNPWSHRGADDIAAVLGSAGQGLFMRIGNEDNFAWRLYAPTIVAASFVPFYFLMRELFRTRVAILATGFLASSHYLFGYAHHGLYVDGLLPTALALWLLIVGLKRDSSLALFGAGLSLGMGFYGFETGRAAVAVVALFMLTFGIRAFRPPVFVPLAAGFILLVLPLFATDGVHHVLDQMSSQSVVDYSSTITGDRMARFQMNVQFSFVSFNFSNAGRHYVWGSLADPITAALFVLGLGVALFRLNRGAYRLIVIWYLVEVAFGGFSNPYPMVPVSRLQAVVMPVAVLAAIATDAIMRPFTDLSPLRRLVSDRGWRFATSSLVIMVFLPAVLSLNLNRFWYQMPRRFGAPSNEAVVVRASRLPQCAGQNIVVVAHDPLSLLDKVFRSYRTEPMPVFYYYPQAIESLKNIETPACLIVQRSGVPTDHLDQLSAEIARRFPDFVETDVTDVAKLRLVNLFAPAQQ